MILETVNSTAIHAVGYDWDRHILEIVFTGGGIYHFTNVPPNIFMGLLRSTSKGHYFQENIRGRFENRRLGRFRRRFQRAGTTKSAQRSTPPAPRADG